MEIQPRHAGARRLAAAISAILATGAVQAAQPADELPEIIVTATRRAEDIQDIPINIAALSGEQLQQQGITDLATLGRSVPGLFVIDQGKRTSNQIVVRGLNVSNVNAQDSANNQAGGIVSTYVGEIPLYIDLVPEDLERIEVLLGPQGTLYGAGTMGGAIRYVPTRPKLDATTLTLRGSGYSLAESDDWGKKGGFTVNLPFGDIFAFRASLDYADDPGFIDNPFLVKQAGLSDPEPDFTNPAAVAANLYRKNDIDYTKTLSGRMAFRGQPTPDIDVNFTYYFQDMESGGRSSNSVAAFGTGRYESAIRYLEPNDRTNRLAALEIMADLGFADLTSASAVSRFKQDGSRDQTDLLITLELGYEAFPTFSAFTRDTIEEQTFNQELRLVSKTTGPLSWIAGLFYNRLENSNASSEFTPHYDDYLAALFTDLYGTNGTGRPDDLEYYAPAASVQTEKALYGEIGYDITDKWQVSAGARLYKYDLETASGYDTPVLFTAAGIYGPDEINIALEPASQSDSGTLFKLNTRYRFTPDLMGYATISEGYRIGSFNAPPACTQADLDNIANGVGQPLCALPNERQYFPDKTVNYELGLRSQWLNGRLTLNGSVYFIDWTDPQLSGTTVNGSLPITTNGKGAETRGIEFSFAAQLTDRLTVSGSYAHTEAELSADAPGLLRLYIPPGFGPSGLATQYVDGKAGDRLPGSPEDQATLLVDYQLPIGSSWTLALNYGLSMVGDVITRTGLRVPGETLPGYTVHQAAATLRGDTWSLGLYSRNLFNKYAETGTRSNPLFVQTVADENGDPVQVRVYMHDVLRPQEVGLRFTYDFNL